MKKTRDLKNRLNHNIGHLLLNTYLQKNILYDRRKNRMDYQLFMLLDNLLIFKIIKCNWN